jgi:hypothetical protein
MQVILGWPVLHGQHLEMWRQECHSVQCWPCRKEVRKEVRTNFLTTRPSWLDCNDQDASMDVDANAVPLPAMCMYVVCI